MFLRISPVAVMVLVGAGCVTGDVDEPRTASAQHELIGGGGCDVFMCGTNSPQIAELGFWDLNVPTTLGTWGKPNVKELQIYAFYHDMGVYLPRVTRGRLFAIPTTTVAPYNVTLSGSGLTNGFFLLSNGVRFFKITVAEVNQVASWAQPVSGFPHVTLESYLLNWNEFKNGWGDARNVCTNPPSRENPDALGMVGSLAFHTLLFEGDLIDPVGKRDTGVDPLWFNLGCAGSALAKLALTGHTEAARNAGTFVTTLPERQTMLKLLTADYCGDGTPFTVAGQPLNWRDDRGTMKLLKPADQLVREARWTEAGPACLDKPRVDVHPTTLSDQVFGVNADIYALATATCAKMPPQCDDLTLETDGYHLLSATP
jgi:hypothetical protein